MAQPWRVELFSCFDDIPTLLIGWICPGYLFGQNAQQIDGSSWITMCIGYTCLSGCCCAHVCLHKPRREKLRGTFNLVEEPSDCLSTSVLSPCANCQEAREMQLRGVQPGTRITVGTQPH